MSPKASLPERAARPPHLVARRPVQHAGLDQAEGRQEPAHLGALPVDLLGNAVHADQEPGATLARADRAERLAVEQLERGGHEVRAHDRARGAARVLQVVESRDDEAVDVGARAELHRRLHDDAERAERADEELRQVVARDVLHDLAAAAHEGPVGHDHGEPDEQVARGAVQMPARSRGIAREDAAERRALGPGRVERQPLTPLGQLALQRGEGNARLGGGREIARLVLDDPAHALEAEHQAEALGRRADAELGAAAGGRHGNPRLARQPQDRGDVVLRAGEDHGLGRAPLEDIRRAVHPGEHVRGAGNAAELLERK